MGNANGSDNGGGGGGGVVDDSKNKQTARVASTDLMASYPPHDHRHSRSPSLFSSQIPVPSLSRNDSSSLNPLTQNESHRAAIDQPIEQGIPTIINWNLGGNSVAVEGSWDNWRTRKTLQRTGKDHSILLVLPAGIFHYNLIVDGKVRHIPDLPSETDATGHVRNLLDVRDYVPENLASVLEFEAPPSPESSYGQVLPGDEDFAKDPMLVPPQLRSTVLGSEATTTPKPQHVVLNHVFMDKGRSSESIVSLGLTHRFQSKYVTVVLYKPLER